MDWSSPEPAVHGWTGDEDLPELVPAESLELQLAGVPMPPSVVEKRSKGLRTKNLETPGWKISMSDIAVVRGDLPAKILKSAAIYSMELFVMLQDYIGDPKDFVGLFSTRLFKDCAEYKRYAARAGAYNAESFYDPRSAEIVMCFNLHPSRELFQRAFAHEFVHAYIDRVWNKTNPLWLMEGLAEWFSNITWRGHIFVPGQMNKAGLFTLGSSVQFDTLNMRDLIHISREDMYGYNFARYYAQAWSLVDYIMTMLPYDTLAGILSGEPFNYLEHEAAWTSHVRMMLDR